MFRIGEFSRIARVSTRLLRYYDGIGLFSPGRIDPATGYRFYLADQLAQLNRILALKDLGLSLEQVARMLDEKITAGEIRGMLALKKAELERSLSEEAARLRHIESRLRQIEERRLARGFRRGDQIRRGAAFPLGAADLSRARRRGRDAWQRGAHGDRARAERRAATRPSSSPIPTSMTRRSIWRSASA